MGATAYLFEPEPRHYSFLNRNSHFFGKVYPFALSDYDGESDFFVGKESNLGGSSIVKSSNSWENSGYEKMTKVKVRRFDNLIKDSYGLDRPAFIKIDVEGNELETLKGMEGYLELGHDSPIWCEVRGPLSDRNPDSYSRVTSYLRKWSYKPYRIVDNKIQLFTPNQKDLPRVFDLLYLKHPNLR